MFIYTLHKISVRPYLSCRIFVHVINGNYYARKSKNTWKSTKDKKLHEWFRRSSWNA